MSHNNTAVFPDLGSTNLITEQNFGVVYTETELDDALSHTFWYVFTSAAKENKIRVYAS